MSEKKTKKTIEELCRSCMSVTAAGEIWPSLSQTSNHRLLRSPSPRESFSRSCRRTENTTRHALFTSSSFSTDHMPGIPKQSLAYEGEKRAFFHQSSHETVKRPFFPGIPPQVVTHAEPPFPGTDTQPLPPINMPKIQEKPGCSSKTGATDDRPYTVVGQTQFEGNVSHDLVCAVTEERRGKRKLEAIKRPGEGEERREAWRAARQYDNHHGKKKCAGNKKGRRARKFQKPLAWKSPWPDNDDDSEWGEHN